MTENPWPGNLVMAERAIEAGGVHAAQYAAVEAVIAEREREGPERRLS
jgi:hypothetical protein